MAEPAYRYDINGNSASGFAKLLNGIFNLNTYIRNVYIIAPNSRQHSKASIPQQNQDQSQELPSGEVPPRAAELIPSRTCRITPQSWKWRLILGCSLVIGIVVVIVIPIEVTRHQSKYPSGSGCSFTPCTNNASSPMSASTSHIPLPTRFRRKLTQS
jgi:hypothetical protein